MSTNTTRPGGTHENGITRPALTKFERDALVAIIRHKADNDGNSPAFRDIAAALGWKSVGSVSQLLDVLQGKGYIRFSTKNKKAAITVVGGRWISPDLTDIGIRKYGPSLDPEINRCRTCGSIRIYRSGECETCYKHRQRTGRTRKRRQKTNGYGSCDCGQPATVTVLTNHGQFRLCRSCARLELEMD